jgi:hypothetical protein
VLHNDHANPEKAGVSRSSFNSRCTSTIKSRKLGSDIAHTFLDTELFLAHVQRASMHAELYEIKCFHVSFLLPSVSDISSASTPRHLLLSVDNEGETAA